MMDLVGLGENSDGLAAMGGFELHGIIRFSILEICNIFSFSFFVGGFEFLYF